MSEVLQVENGSSKKFWSNDRSGKIALCEFDEQKIKCIVLNRKIPFRDLISVCQACPLNYFRVLNFINSKEMSYLRL